MKRIVIAALLTTGVLAMTSCRKDPVKNLEGDEGLIYITKHSDSVNFGMFRTFSIADSVAVISNNQLEGKVRTNVDAAYIDAVKNQLVQRGYTQVGREQNPDLALPSAVFTIPQPGYLIMALTGIPITVLIGTLIIGAMAVMDIISPHITWEHTL
jgi:hypothetical protein